MPAAKGQVASESHLSHGRRMTHAPALSQPSPARIRAAVEAALQRCGREASSLLGLTVSVQEALRCVPPEAQGTLGRALGVPAARVQGLVEFYAFLSEQPRGAYDLLIGRCVSDECHGAGRLCTALAEALRVAPGCTRSDGRVSLDSASCTGLCDQPVAALVNGLPLAGLKPADAPELAALVERGVPPAEWPARWRPAASRVHRRDRLLHDRLSPGQALARGRALGPEALLACLEDSGLRGRGGAGYRTGLKWRQCRDAIAERGRPVVICNADEGEPGTFKDRWLLEHEAGRLLEGMSLCAEALGGAEGWIYLRAEYRWLRAGLQRQIDGRRRAGTLGEGFDIRIALGAGAYICGEESALIESLEGQRGIPRNRPPYPVTHGYLGRPTVVNNVESFVAAASIVQHGPHWWNSVGTARSAGTKLFSLSGDCERPGIYEFPFGTPLATLLAAGGAGEVAAVQVGGPSGVLVGPGEFQRPLAYESLSTGGAVMVLGAQRDPLELVRNHAHFFAHESCGFCTPCRVGSTLQSELLDKVLDGKGTLGDLHELERLARQVNAASHCGLGQSAGNPVIDALGRFRERFMPRLSASFCPGFDLDGALAEARRLSGRDDARAHLDSGR